MKWLMNEHEPDLYDARMRDWYIKAAASPKEIVILLDSSGKLERFRTYFLIWVWNWNSQSLERKLDISTIVSKIDHKMWLKISNSFRINDWSEKRDCQARRAEHLGNFGRGRLCHHLQVLKGPNPSCRVLHGRRQSWTCSGTPWCSYLSSGLTWFGMKGKKTGLSITSLDRNLDTLIKSSNTLDTSD